MCGIVGYVGSRRAQPILLEGLKQLEYRGYDSAGLAVIEKNGAVSVRRSVGKLAGLESLVESSPMPGQIGIGHTRWATHGMPSQRNAHPHTGMRGRVVIVHNGIVENYLPLRQELTSEGVEFNSDTDTEVIVQLIELHMANGSDLEHAVRRSLGQIRGSNAIVAMALDSPEQLVCARLGNAGGIALGLGQDEMFIASDIPAILKHTREMIFLENRQMAVVEAGEYRVSDLDGRPQEAAVHSIPWDPVSAEKGPYRYFMEREIFDQPRALVDTIRGRVDFDLGRLEIPELGLGADATAEIDKIFIVACGTSYYAGLVGKYMIEAIAKVPVEVGYGSEFRYADPLIDERTAVLAISQSGETADTLAACDLARSKGAKLWAIVNVFGSQATRISDGYIAMHAGPEIGVATTKAFTASLVDLYLLACILGKMRGVISESGLRELLADLAHLPELAGQVLERDQEYQALAERFCEAQNFLFIGRGINYPIALEGALKLKEISYIHAEGYPAGEMKHGPIALIDEQMPVVAIATRDDLYDKMVSQIEQAKARGGTVIALATAGDSDIAGKADYVIYVPDTPPLLSPIVNVMPLQLLSFHIALLRSCDVDQPRNLAKSVTVE
ncbi:MAG: glutamine--fructose-6-phosphate transaminase (isomerizing) [Chloroflexota bacterium]|nr:MAG: glutamine--fructose-6-phosphate transaminase (isomerizing) [Chloroflexota bacterium]